MGNKNITPQLRKLCDITTQAHTDIQKNFSDINPIVGVSYKMRESGVPADVMTIDCLKTSKQIIIVLHDSQPEIFNYQYSFKDKNPGTKFETYAMSDLSSEVLFNWIKDYFKGNTP